MKNPLSSLKKICRVVWTEIVENFLSYFFFCLFSPISLLLKLFHFRVIKHGPNIGNFCTQIDAYAKEKLLKRIPNYKLIIYPYSGIRLKAANRYLCHLWKQHFFVVTNPIVARLFQFVFTAPWLRLERPYFSKLPGESYYAVNRIYYDNADKKDPMLKIPEEDQDKGWKILENFGVSKKDWFVCFFARESGFYDHNDQKNQGIIRNVEVGTYEKALREVIRRGGWCIRMGSSKMNPLPENLRRLPRMIDYPQTHAVSEFMDVFLAATCKFMLTCASGISYLPGLFGVPILATNLITFNEAIPLYSGDIAILKKFYSKKLKRILTFPEIFTSYIADHYLIYYFNSLHLELIANTEDEIYEATKEMLDRLEHSYVESSDYQLLQKKFEGHIPQCMYCKDSLGKIGDHFLKTCKNLL